MTLFGSQVRTALSAEHEAPEIVVLAGVSSAVPIRVLIYET